MPTFITLVETTIAGPRTRRIRADRIVMITPPEGDRTKVSVTVDLGGQTVSYQVEESAEEVERAVTGAPSQAAVEEHPEGRGTHDLPA